MLALGVSYAGILRALDDENTKLDLRDRVTIDSIRYHTSRHFPVQQIARATYREILERRAEQNQVDFVQGVATAITPMASLETVMVNGYETLVDPHTKVDVNTGMIAAGRLQSLIDSPADQSDLLQMRLQFRRILDAVRSTVPQEMWGAIADELFVTGHHAGRSVSNIGEGDESTEWSSIARRAHNSSPLPYLSAGCQTGCPAIDLRQKPRIIAIIHERYGVSTDFGARRHRDVTGTQ
jgi:hypothetical protein